MTTATKTITSAIFTDSQSAEDAINELREMGVPDSDISYLYRNDKGDTEEHTAEESLTDAGSERAKGAGTGAVEGALGGGALGAIAGLVVATGVLPGVGAILAAGPIASALGLTGVAATTVTGGAWGAAAGGIIGALTGLGVSEPDAHLYEERIRSGNILLVIESDRGGIAETLERYGASEIREYAGTA
jgi:hypothetical protein